MMHGFCIRGPGMFARPFCSFWSRFHPASPMPSTDQTLSLNNSTGLTRLRLSTFAVRWVYYSLCLVVCVCAVCFLAVSFLSDIREAGLDRLFVVVRSSSEFVWVPNPVCITTAPFLWYRCGLRENSLLCLFLFRLVSLVSRLVYRLDLDGMDRRVPYFCTTTYRNLRTILFSY